MDPTHDIAKFIDDSLPDSSYTTIFNDRAISTKLHGDNDITFFHLCWRHLLV